MKADRAVWFETELKCFNCVYLD
uniref:Uncharacterized protein n=1 Tax=Rhizophora mucronata TaxID=61149 RepID=A0A2P2NFF8_RHIMU